MMTNGPNAKVGKILEVDLPRPRTRKQLLEHPDYYALREELLSFLADCDHESEESNNETQDEIHNSEKPTQPDNEQRLSA